MFTIAIWQHVLMNITRVVIYPFNDVERSKKKALTLIPHPTTRYSITVSCDFIYLSGM
jgi:hypothetical protein